MSSSITSQTSSKKRLFRAEKKGWWYGVAIGAILTIVPRSAINKDIRKENIEKPRRFG